MPEILSRLATACARRPLRVLAAWVALAVAVTLVAGSVSARTGDDVSVPGTDSAKAAAALSGEFPGNAGTSSSIVLHDADGDLHADAAADALSRAPGVADASPPVVAKDGRTAIVSVTLDRAASGMTKPEAQAVLNAAKAAAPGVQVEAGGPLGSKLSQASVHRSEALGLAAAVVVLLLAFGTVPAMLVPIVTAVIGVIVALRLITIAGSLTSIPQVAPTLATMIGLGVGIDYALFLVTRARAMRRAGHEGPEAIGRAIAASGGAVVFAGATVVVALCALLVADLSIITKLGWTSAIAVVVAVLAAITLLPAALGLLGDRIERLAVRRSTTLDESPGWRRWGERVARRPGAALVVSLVVLATLAAPTLTLSLGQDSPQDKSPSTTERRAYDLVADAFGPGYAGPLVVAVSGTAQDADALRDAIAATPGVASVSPPRVSADGKVAQLQVQPATGPSDEHTADLVARLRDDVIPDALRGTAAQAHVGGATAAQVDLAARIAAKLPLIILAVVAVSIVLLLLAFRSVVLPLKAAAMNLVSVGAAYGILTMVFEHGWGSGLIGLDGPVPIVSYVPMMMFAILFGLSMDYEVFLLSRVQEHHHAGDGTEESVVAGLASTGRIITAAALIMVSVFASFLLVPDPTIKMFGLGLSAAIAIDATLVRCLLVPASMILMGRANWWLPGWLDRRLPNVTIERAGA